MVVIALDIGGTKIKGALVNEKGYISHTKRVDTEGVKGKSAILSHINYVIKFLKLISKEEITAIGISMSGIINNGKILRPGENTSSLKNFNLKKYIQNKFKIKTIVENDANCFALAEAIYGRYKNNKSIVGIIWGTGIGSGIIHDKQIITGSGGAGEIGKIKVPIFIDKTKKHHYLLEHLCGGKHIEQLYLQTHKKYAKPSKILTQKNSKHINKIVISSLSWAIANIINTINPEIIILGGGVSCVPQSVYNQIRKETAKYCDKYLLKKTKILKYSISDDAGILGAAHLAITLNN